MGAWLDGYTHIKDSDHSGGGSYGDYPWRVVWHTVEGGISEDMARAHRSPPHLWVDPSRGLKLQTVPLDRSSYAMWDQGDYPYRTNKARAIQIEIAGHATEAGGWSDAYLRFLALEVLVPIVDFIRSQGGTFDYGSCPDPAGSEQIGGSSLESAPQRFGWETWHHFNSHCGHRHVTGNGDRYDPGLLDLCKIGEIAQGHKGPLGPPIESILTSMAYVVQDPDGTMWVVNPPFKLALTDDKLRLDYIARGWLPAEWSKVHAWTLGQLVEVKPSAHKL